MKGIARCVKLDKKISDTLDLILLSTIEFNKTNHSVTNVKSVELIRSNNVETGLQVTNILLKDHSLKNQTGKINKKKKREK